MYWPSSSFVSSFTQTSTADFGAGEFQPFSQLGLIWFAPFLMEELPCAMDASLSSTKPVPLMFQHKFWATISFKQGSNQGMNRDRQSTFYYLCILLFSLLLILFSTTSERRKIFLTLCVFYHHPSNHNSVFGMHTVPFWHWVHMRNSNLWFKIQFFLFPVERLFS